MLLLHFSQFAIAQTTHEYAITLYPAMQLEQTLGLTLHFKQFVSVQTVHALFDRLNPVRQLLQVTVALTNAHSLQLSGQV